MLSDDYDLLIEITGLFNREQYSFKMFHCYSDGYERLSIYQVDCARNVIV